MKTSRRRFLRRTAQGAGMIAAGAQFLPLPSLRAQSARPGYELRLPSNWSGDSLTVAPASLAVWPGYSTAVSAINGQLFNLQRTDFSVPFGDLETWEYRNTGTEPHPMHAHAALCQVLSRSSEASLPPEDAGWKDTVLVNPGETVRVLTRFDTHSGVFAHHCHNLEHEDSGMMQNFEVLHPPTLTVQRDGTSVSLSWPEAESDWRLESSAGASGVIWDPVTASPETTGGRWTMTISELTGKRFYRLVKP